MNQLRSILGIQTHFPNLNPCIPEGNQTLIPSKLNALLLSHRETISHRALLAELSLLQIGGFGIGTEQELPPRRLALAGSADGATDPRPFLALLNDLALAGAVGRGPSLRVSECKHVRTGRRDVGN